MNEMINATTSLFPLLTIDSNNSFYYNASILAFSIVGCSNHVLPENLDGLTHVVKMLFSNILFSMIGVYPVLGFILSLVDLTPLLSKNPKMKRVGESLLQMPRLFIEIYLMYRIYWIKPLDVGFMAAAKVIYYFERNARIKKGVRNDFSSWHAAEHMGLYLLFKDTVDVDFSLGYLIFFFFLLVVCIGLFMLAMNTYLHSTMLHRAPNWVKESPELLSYLNDKLRKNKTSIKLHNYIIKPWVSHLKLEFVTWKAIEQICDGLVSNIRDKEYDLVVGISTGGCFVGTCIAKKLNLPYISVQSKLWSEISFLQNYLQTYYYVMGREQMPKTGAIPDVTGKKIILVDDTTYTGITLYGIKKVLLEKGNAHSVDTMVMWTRGAHSPDYFYTSKRIPIIWEWGAELD